VNSLQPSQSTGEAAHSSLIGPCPKPVTVVVNPALSYVAVTPAGHADTGCLRCGKEVTLHMQTQICHAIKGETEAYSNAHQGDDFTQFGMASKKTAYPVTY